MRASVLTAVLGLLFSSVLMAHGPESMDGVPEAVPEARIAEVPDVEGLTAMVLEGAPQGIWLAYSGPDTLTVLDRHGVPMIRFTPDGVQANTASADWPVPRSGASSPSSDTDEWVTVSRSDGFGWMDPRLRAQDHHARDTSRSWRIPLTLYGGERVDLAGQLKWRNLPAVVDH